MTRSNCEMRKTIKVEKYPFPTGWEPAATYMIEGDHQKEVSAFLGFDISNDGIVIMI